VNRFSKINSTVLVGLFYLLLGLVIFRHLAINPGIWNRGDMMFPINSLEFSKWIGLTTNTWWNQEFLGFVTIVEGLPRASYVLVLWLFSLLTDNFSMIQFLWWIFIFSVLGLSMFTLGRYLFKNITIGFFASLVYVLNPWVVDRFFHVLIIQAYAFIPLLIFFFLKLMETHQLRYAFYIALSAFFIIPSHHYTLLSALVVTLFFLAELYGTRSREEMVRKIKSLGLAVAVVVVLLAFYAIPLVISIFSDGGAFGKAQDFSLLTPGLHWGRYGTILNVIRFLGFHESIFVFKGVWIKTLVTYAIPLLTFLPIFSRRWRTMIISSRFYLLYLIYITGIVLAASPTIFKSKLFSLISYMPTSIDPNYYIFLIIFSSSLLGAFGFWIILLRLKRFNTFVGYLWIAAFFIILAVGVKELFLWRHPAFKEITYPSEYLRAAEIANVTPVPDQRILALPESAAAHHSWAPYPQINSDGYLFAKTNFSRTAIELTSEATTNFIRKLVLAEAQNSITSKLTPLMRLASADTIFLVNDDKVAIQAPAYSKSISKNQDLLPIIKSDYIDFYALRSGLSLPHIYVADTVVNASGGAESLIKALPEDEKSRPALYLSRLQPSPVPLDYVGKSKSTATGTLPKLSFSRVNPTKYKVRVTGADGPYTLVFSESFNDSWRVYQQSSVPKEDELVTASYFDGEVIEGEHSDSLIRQNIFETFFKKPLPENSHFLVNGYANSWQINPEDVGGASDYDLVIEYIPQKTYYVGLIISFVGLLVFAVGFSLRYVLRSGKALRQR